MLERAETVELIDQSGPSKQGFIEYLENRNVAGLVRENLANIDAGEALVNRIVSP